MQKKPAISIVTPVWNGLPFIKECVQSVLEQEFTSWELIISDNGSTDGTQAYLDSLKDPRIRVFKQRKNLGIMGNLNFLFKQVRASITQILCADDYFIKPSSLSVIVNFWDQADPDLGFVRFNFNEHFRAHVLKWGKRITPPVIRPEEADLWFFVFGNIPGNLSNVSLRSDLIEKIGFFNENFPAAGDFEFWSRAALKVPMGVQKEMVVYVRRHEKTASEYMNQKCEVLSQKIAVYEQLIERLSNSYKREDLIDYFNEDVTVSFYRSGIKLLFKGRFGFMRRFLQIKSPIVWPKWYLLTAGLRYVFLNRQQELILDDAQEFLNQFQHIREQINVML